MEGAVGGPAADPGAGWPGRLEPRIRLVTMPMQQMAAATVNASWMDPARAALRSAAVGGPPPSSVRWKGMRTIIPQRAAAAVLIFAVELNGATAQPLTFSRRGRCPVICSSIKFLWPRSLLE